MKLRAEKHAKHQVNYPITSELTSFWPLAELAPYASVGTLLLIITVSLSLLLTNYAYITEVRSSWYLCRVRLICHVTSNRKLLRVTFASNVLSSQC
jgi:hypothetical protein